MSRQIFIHDYQYDLYRTYNVIKYELNEGTTYSDDFFKIRRRNPFTIESRCVDYNKPIYKLTFINDRNRRWTIHIEPNNAGCWKISFDEGRVQLSVGCADFFPENGDPEFRDKATDRITALEEFNVEKDNSNENNKKGKN